MPLTAGDDYELCFTVSPERAEQLTIAATKIGIIESLPGLRLNKAGQLQLLEAKGFEHFS
jgi:thiamine-monophosphate kinase